MVSLMVSEYAGERLSLDRESEWKPLVPEGLGDPHEWQVVVEALDSLPRGPAGGPDRT